MKVATEDLKEMVKSAVAEAMKGVKEEDVAEEAEKDEGDNIITIIEDAVDVVNEKRKSAKAEELDGDDITELIDEIENTLDSGDKSDDGAIDVEEIVKSALDNVNEKRKSAKSEEIDGGVIDEILDAVSEIMSDEDANEEAKKKSSYAQARREKKSGRKSAIKRPVQRKYSNIYMPHAETAGAVNNQKSLPKGLAVARAIKCLDVFGRNDPEAAAYHAIKKYGDYDMARQFKALNTVSPTDGGYLIPEVYSDDIIELLYPKTVIVELGAQNVPLSNGTLNIPKITSGTRATWGGERRKINATGPKYGNLRLSAKRLEAIVPQTRELLMSSSLSSDMMFLNDLLRRMQLGLDYGALYGTGKEFQPLGIANDAGIEKVDVKVLGAKEKDLADANGKITADFPVWVTAKALSKNIDDGSAGWTFNSMTEAYLKNMKTTTGAYIYRDEMREGKLLNYPYRVSNQINTNTNGASDIFFGNWADLLIGDQMGLETYTTLDGTWTDDEGNRHSAFDENLAATRALMYVDIGARHAESFIYCKNIKVM